MVANVSYNPYLTQNAPGSFNIQSDGFVQGTAMDDPSARFRLRSGILANSETIPMWGGVGISENIPVPAFQSGAPGGVLQASIVRATSIAGSALPAQGQLTGFSVFDQAYNFVQSPQSPVPMIGSNGTLNYYPLGSKARIAVACDPLLAQLEGDINTSLVSWDFTNQLLVPYETAGNTVSSGTYVSATGVITLTLSAAPTFGVGDEIILSSLTGTGAYANLNGTWEVLTIAADVVTVQGPTLQGAATITGGTLTGTYTIASTGSSYNNTSGLVTLALASNPGFSVGDSITVSSLTGSAINGQNGTYTVLSISGAVVTYQAAAALGATTITGGSVVEGAGVASTLPCRILAFNFGNSMTVQYNAAQNVAQWNRIGNAALIQI